MNICTDCEGTGTIVVDGLNAKRCKCRIERMYKARLPSWVYNPSVREENILKLKDAYRKDLYFVGSDNIVGSHINTALKIVNPERLPKFYDERELLADAFINDPDKKRCPNVMDDPWIILETGRSIKSHSLLPSIIDAVIDIRHRNKLRTWVVRPVELSKESFEYSDALDRAYRDKSRFIRLKVDR